MPGIPDRWDDYKPFEKVILGTNFLAIKVPLSYKYVASMPADRQFTPDNLMLRCEQLGISIGLVVDLTFTRRYYNPQEFTNKGIKYEKIFVEGHNIPNLQCVNRFKSVINEFRKSSPDSVVAVHCTHGINRTGYMICRYLIEVDGWQPDDAIAAFGEARGFPIERENYLSDLRSMTAPPEVVPEKRSDSAGIKDPVIVTAAPAVIAEAVGSSSEGDHGGRKWHRPTPYSRPGSSSRPYREQRDFDGDDRNGYYGYHGYHGYQPVANQYEFGCYGYYDNCGNYFAPGNQAYSGGFSGSHGNQSHHGRHRNHQGNHSLQQGNQSSHGSHGNPSHRVHHGKQYHHSTHGHGYKSRHVSRDNHDEQRRHRQGSQHHRQQAN